MVFDRDNDRRDMDFLISYGSREDGDDYQRLINLLDGMLSRIEALEEENRKLKDPHHPEY